MAEAKTTEQRAMQLTHEMDRLLEYVSSINDERDSVPLLLAVRELWPEIRAALKAAEAIRKRKAAA